MFCGSGSDATPTQQVARPDWVLDVERTPHGVLLVVGRGGVRRGVRLPAASLRKAHRVSGIDTTKAALNEI